MPPFAGRARPIPSAECWPILLAARAKKVHKRRDALIRAGRRVAKLKLTWFDSLRIMLAPLSKHELITSMPKLHILSGVLEGKTFDLVEERVTCGRALDNMIRLEDGTVSHHHAMLVLDGSDYKLRDLNSTNGTRVNGMRIVETKLHNGDQVRMGSVEMRFESDIKKASQPLPPMQTGVDLSQFGAGSAPPSSYGSVSPFGRKRRGERTPWIWAVLGLGFVAALVLGWFFVRFLNLK